MKINCVALLCGVLFGFGLCLSEMINPAVVIAFLDVTGNWNPALLFVMGGALLVGTVAFQLVKKVQQPVCCARFELPQNTHIDKPLILGAVIFGVGWGLAGICPGPAVAALALHLPKAVIFFLALMVGNVLYYYTNQNN